ncbi:hypothetical protein V2J09_012396 [Rumex salicifolius]
MDILISEQYKIVAGVAIRTGSQAKVAIVNIISYYIIGIPIGCILAYVADYGIKVMSMSMRIDWITKLITTIGQA